MTQDQWGTAVREPLHALWQATRREWTAWPPEVRRILQAVEAGETHPAEAADRLWHWLLWPPETIPEPLIEEALADWLLHGPETTGASRTQRSARPATSGICPTAALPWVVHRLECARNLAVALGEMPWLIRPLRLSDAPLIRRELATRHWAQQGYPWALELACDALGRPSDDS